MDGVQTRGFAGYGAVALVGILACAWLASPGASASPGGASAAGAGATAAAKRCIRARLGVTRSCVRIGQRCNPQLRHAYLLAGLECRARRLRRASVVALREGEPLRLDAHGRIPFAIALQAFNADVARLPGVKTPKGAVGRIPDPTSVIAALEAQRRRLTRAQRAVLDRVLRPNPAAVSAATPAEEQLYAGLVGEAAARVRAHGYALNHKLALFFPDTAALPGGNKDVAAFTVPGWLYQTPGYTDTCLIYVTPLGLGGTLAGQRRLIAHEMFHCAQEEFFSSLAQSLKAPQWVIEGSAEWAGNQIALEWNGSDQADYNYTLWLAGPETDLGRRDYDAVGFWSLLQESGADVFSRLHGVLSAAAAGGDFSAYGAAIGTGSDSLFNTWGPGFVRNRALPANWDLTGPGMVASTPQHFVIDDGAELSNVTDPRGAYGAELSLEADVIDVQAQVSHGRLHTLGGETNLGTELLCTKDGGCGCPDDTPLDARQVPKGIAEIGWQGGGAVVAGESVDEACKKKGKPPPSTPTPKTPACSLLSRSGVTSYLGGSFFAMGRACEGGRCLSRVQSPRNPEQSVCAYARGAFITLRRYGTARQARAFVRRYTRGPLRPVSIGADAASLGTNASGTTVFLAVGRAAVTFSMGASSDLNPNPIWHNASATRRFAGRIARLLR
jgi:hypothetical protein